MKITIGRQKPTLEELKKQVEQLERERLERIEYEELENKKKSLLKEKTESELKKSILFKIFSVKKDKSIKPFKF